MLNFFSMNDLGVQAGPETRSVTAIPFRFEVTWRSLTRPPESSTLVAPVSDANGASFPANVRSTRISQAKETALRFVLKSKVSGPWHAEPAPTELTAPSFASPANTASIPRWTMALAGGLLLVSLAFAMALKGGRSPSTEASPEATEMGAAGWVSEWASDPRGSALGRQISLYRPSFGLSNYSLEFTGRIERRSLGWVFRAADTRNYYVGKLQESQSGGRLMLTRFAVVRGVEGRHTRITLPVLASVGAFKIRLEARRSRFTIYVQNQVADHWQEDQLTTGGVGFINERDERGRVESVRISVLKDGIRQ